ncbi:MAG: ankyrin repeat domain-containing protein [Fimbriiglobus sp.]
MEWSPENQARAFLSAVSLTRLARVKELLARGVDPNTADPWDRTALQMAVRYACNGEATALAIVQTLLAAGADLHAADQDGFTALKHAAVYAYLDLLKFLIAAGADVNHRTPDGLTAIGLIECCAPIKDRRKRVIKLLEQAGGVR